jgi:hypothetical protein
METLEVLCQTDQPLGIFPDVAKRSIATLAQEPSHLSGLVIVIQIESCVGMY